MDVREITAFNFKAFTSSNKICVLRAQAGKGIGFNKILQSQLEQNFKNSLSLGWIDTGKINYRSKVIQEFIRESIPKIGLLTGNTIFPGYYLFKNGNLVAFHPGTIDPSKIDPRVHGIAAIFGAIAGLIVGITEKDGMKGLQVFLEAMEAPVSFKVLQFFNEILSANSSSYSQKRHRFVYVEELLNAYRLLQVSPDASDKEVAKAWKDLQLKNHPDLHPNEFEAKSKFCAELNNAYDLIKKSRAAKQ